MDTQERSQAHRRDKPQGNKIGGRPPEGVWEKDEQYLAGTSFKGSEEDYAYDLGQPAH